MKRFPAEPTSPREARKHVTRACEGLVDADTVGIVGLLTTELVTNAVVHARSWADLEVIRLNDELLVEVTDAAGRSPIEPPGVSSPLHERGRGLALVAALSSGWGVRRDGSHKTVWFTVTHEGSR